MNASVKQLLVFLRAECSLTSKSCSRRQGGRSCEHLLMENPKDIGHCNCRYLSTALRYRLLSGHRVLFRPHRHQQHHGRRPHGRKDLWSSNFSDLLNGVCVENVAKDLLLVLLMIGGQIQILSFSDVHVMIMMKPLTSIKLFKEDTIQYKHQCIVSLG